MNNQQSKLPETKDMLGLLKVFCRQEFGELTPTEKASSLKTIWLLRNTSELDGYPPGEPSTVTRIDDLSEGITLTDLADCFHLTPDSVKELQSALH